MLDPEDPDRRTRLAGVGPQTEHRRVRPPEIDDLDVDRDHAAKHRLVGIGFRLADAALKILRAIDRIHLKRLRA